MKQDEAKLARIHKQAEQLMNRLRRRLLRGVACAAAVVAVVAVITADNTRSGPLCSQPLFSQRVVPRPLLPLHFPYCRILETKSTHDAIAR